MTQVSSQNFKGFSPKIWGPSAWKFIHTIALSYPDNPTPFDKENYKAFFLSLQNVVPCARCREHYEKNIKDININNYLDNSSSLFLWTNKIHNLANASYGGKQTDVIKAKNFFFNWLTTNVSEIPQLKKNNNIVKKEHFSSPKPMSKKKILGICLLIIVSIIITHFIMKKLLK
jgi:hypothetical protein